MKGAGQPHDLDDDELSNPQSMSIFEEGPEKDWFEREMADKLIHLQDENIDGKMVIND